MKLGTNYSPTSVNLDSLGLAMVTNERGEGRSKQGNIGYDTRCYINVRSKANMSQLNLPHGADN